MTVTLILGGARSGKSRLAESLAHGQRHYIATAQAHDDEMRARILEHQQQRGPSWETHEESFELSDCLKSIDEQGNFILVDCLTLWLTNLMLAERNWMAATGELVTALSGLSADAVLVSNETGLGIVPDNALARAFRDAQGRVNQEVASVADNVVFVAAGLPLVLKGTLPKP